MDKTTLGWLVVLAIAILWAGSSIWGNYTAMKREIARAEANAKFYEATVQGIRDAAIANADVNRAALARAIERLAEKREE